MWPLSRIQAETQNKQARRWGDDAHSVCAAVFILGDNTEHPMSERESMH